MRRVAIYARISKLNDKSATSIDTQISGLPSFAMERPLLQVKGIYVDIGTGRSKESRIQLNRLLDDCMAGDYDLIITKSSAGLPETPLMCSPYAGSLKKRI